MSVSRAAVSVSRSAVSVSRAAVSVSQAAGGLFRLASHAVDIISCLYERPASAVNVGCSWQTSLLSVQSAVPISQLSQPSAVHWNWDGKE